MFRSMTLAACLALGATMAAPAAPHDAAVAAVAEVVAAHPDTRTARRAGFRPFGDDVPLMGRHWVDRDAPDDAGDAALDPRRPNVLMYTEIGGREVPVGAAFVVRIGPGEPLPEGFAGPADRWHVHDLSAMIAALAEDRPLLGGLAGAWLEGRARRQGDHRHRLAMVHVWTIPNPDGPFADYNRLLPYMKLGLPTSLADGASLDAARGLDLATRDGCDRAVDGPARLAGLPRRAVRAQKRACATLAETVRARLREGGTAAALNAAAETAWRRFEAHFEAGLTPKQKARLEALVEADLSHGAMHR